MSFKRLDAEDFLVSAESVTAALWSSNTGTLTRFFSSSVQEASSAGQYYLSVFQTSSVEASAEVQFDIAFAQKDGSGSLYFNTAVPGKSPSRSIYGQYRNLVLGDENAQFVFGNVTGSRFYAIAVERSRYKEKLLAGTMTLLVSGASATNVISITDNSTVSNTVTYCDAGRVFQLVSGSAGRVFTGVNSNGYSANSGSYGFFLPDVGVLLLNAQALDNPPISGGISLGTGLSPNTDDSNDRKLFNAIARGASWTMNSEETLTSDFVYVRARNSEFNYSENPSFISGSTGEVLYANFINSPTTYMTTVGLYNDNNDLLAVAKLSRPLPKDFTKEALVRIKLDF